MGHSRVSTSKPHWISMREWNFHPTELNLTQFWITSIDRVAGSGQIRRTVAMGSNRSNPKITSIVAGWRHQHIRTNRGLKIEERNNNRKLSAFNGLYLLSSREQRRRKNNWFWKRSKFLTIKVFVIQLQKITEQATFVLGGGQRSTVFGPQTAGADLLSEWFPVFVVEEDLGNEQIKNKMSH